MTMTPPARTGDRSLGDALAAIRATADDDPGTLAAHVDALDTYTVPELRRLALDLAALVVVAVSTPAAPLDRFLAAVVTVHETPTGDDTRE